MKLMYAPAEWKHLQMEHEAVRRMLDLIFDMYDVNPSVWHQCMGCKETERQILCWLKVPHFPCISTLMGIIKRMLLSSQNLKVRLTLCHSRTMKNFSKLNHMFFEIL